MVDFPVSCESSLEGKSLLESSEAQITILSGGPRPFNFLLCWVSWMALVEWINMIVMFKVSTIMTNVWSCVYRWLHKNNILKRWNWHEAPQQPMIVSCQCHRVPFFLLLLLLLIIIIIIIISDQCNQCHQCHQSHYLFKVKVATIKSPSGAMDLSLALQRLHTWRHRCPEFNLRWIGEEGRHLEGIEATNFKW